MFQKCLDKLSGDSLNNNPSNTRPKSLGRWTFGLPPVRRPLLPALASSFQKEPQVGFLNVMFSFN